MSFDQYNALTMEDKFRFQWQVWDKYLASSSVGDGGLLWNHLYGHSKLMVNARRLLECDRYLFDNDEYLLNNVDLPIMSKTHSNSPIMQMRERFKSAKGVFTNNAISNIRYSWLKETIKRGERFTVVQNSYNICSLWGISVRIEKSGWNLNVCELPMRDLSPLNSI